MLDMFHETESHIDYIVEVVPVYISKDRQNIHPWICIKFPGISVMFDE